MEEIETGVRFGMSDSDYRKLSCVNASTLKLFRKSPLHAYVAMTQPTPPTKAMQLGTAVHMALLEPDRYLQELRIGPANDRRTKGWQDWDRVTLATLKLTGEEANTVERIRAQIRKRLSGTALKLLTGKGTSEATAVWQDPQTGLYCKARADRITRIERDPVIVELKTARDASPKSFGYAIRDYGYDLSAAWYLRGFSAVLEEMPRRVIFLVVETEEPHAIATYELGPRALERAGEECMEYLQAYKACIESNVWPGWPDMIVELK